jgi:death on curing protein
MIVYLTKEQIVLSNKSTVLEHGGNFLPPNNFLHEENLDYLIEIVQSEMFGQPLYSSIQEKASVYCFNIICNHIFTDGNKRTGLVAGHTFLLLNGFDFDDKVTDTQLTDFILSVAAGEKTLEECMAWFNEFAIELA